MTDDPGRATDAPPWLDVDDLEPEPRSSSASRSRWLTAMAVAPWLVAGAIVWTHDDPPHDTPAPAPAGAGATTSPAPTGTAPSTPSPAGTATEAPTATLTASRAWTAVGEDEARAVAIVTARRWLTTVGPDDGGPDDGPATADDGNEAADEVYAEHLVVEGVDHPAPGAAVVTVRALVLHVAGDGYDAVEVQRLAVPLRFDASGATPAGEPWPLPVDDPPEVVALPGLVPIEEGDLRLEAAEAMQAAGYVDVHLLTLHRSDGWPLVATADARVAEDAPRRRVTVWLRRHLGRFVVAGTRPRADRDVQHDHHQPDGRSPASPSGHPTEPHHEEAP